MSTKKSNDVDTEVPLVQVCIPHATGDRLLKDGELVRADDPAVLANPSWFCNSSLPDSEKPTLASVIGARAQEEAEREQRERAEMLRDMVECVVGLSLAGPPPREIFTGNYLHKDDALVKRFPDAFKAA